MDDTLQGSGETLSHPQPSASTENGVSGLKTRLVDAAQTRKDGIADQIEGLADTIERAGSQFDGQQDWLASAIRQGATELDTFASSLRRKGIGEIIEDVRAFAERQPAIFIGASLAAGFALARFGKIAAADLSRDDLPTVPELTRHG